VGECKALTFCHIMLPSAATDVTQCLVTSAVWLKARV
jgi:hypothetical protein